MRKGTTFAPDVTVWVALMVTIVFFALQLAITFFQFTSNDILEPFNLGEEEARIDVDVTIESQKEMRRASLYQHLIINMRHEQEGELEEVEDAIRDALYCWRTPVYPPGCGPYSSNPEQGVLEALRNGTEHVVPRKPYQIWLENYREMDAVEDRFPRSGELIYGGGSSTYLFFIPMPGHENVDIHSRIEGRRETLRWGE